MCALPVGKSKEKENEVRISFNMAQSQNSKLSTWSNVNIVLNMMDGGKYTQRHDRKGSRWAGGGGAK